MSDVTYIVLCDLLMNIHVSQTETQLSTLSDDSTVGCSAVLFEPGHTTCVLTKSWKGKNILFSSLNKILAVHGID